MTGIPANNGLARKIIWAVVGLASTSFCGGGAMLVHGHIKNGERLATLETKAGFVDELGNDLKRIGDQITVLNRATTEMAMDMKAQKEIYREWRDEWKEWRKQQDHK